MAKFLDVSEADIVQHYTTDEELKKNLQQLKAAYTDSKGNLDQKSYCKALNSYRDNLLFTVKELEAGIKEARKKGDSGTVEGYQTAIDQYNRHAEIIKNEIRKNGGKVNK